MAKKQKSDKVHEKSPYEMLLEKSPADFEAAWETFVQTYIDEQPEEQDKSLARMRAALLHKIAFEEVTPLQLIVNYKDSQTLENSLRAVGSFLSDQTLEGKTNNSNTKKLAAFVVMRLMQQWKKQAEPVGMYALAYTNSKSSAEVDKRNKFDSYWAEAENLLLHSTIHSILTNYLLKSISKFNTYGNEGNEDFRGQAYEAFKSGVRTFKVDGGRPLAAHIKHHIGAALQQDRGKSEKEIVIQCDDENRGWSKNVANKNSGPQGCIIPIEDLLEKVQNGKDRIIFQATWNGKSIEQIAELLSLNPNSTRQRLNRARRQIKKCLKETEVSAGGFSEALMPEKELRQCKQSLDEQRLIMRRILRPNDESCRTISNAIGIEINLLGAITNTGPDTPNPANEDGFGGVKEKIIKYLKDKGADEEIINQAEKTMVSIADIAVRLHMLKKQNDRNDGLKRW